MKVLIMTGTAAIFIPQISAIECHLAPHVSYELRMTQHFMPIEMLNLSLQYSASIGTLDLNLQYFARIGAPDFSI